MTLKDFKYGFIKSLPVMFGYIVLGIALGILMNQAGYNAFWPFLCSLVIYTGAFQFVIVPFLATAAPLPTILATCLAMSSRQLFYGVSFIEKFKSMGRRYLYMVFSLTDETYGLFTTITYPDDVDEDNAMFSIAFLCHAYWITGSVLGAVIGMLLPFSLDGIDFSMTAMFVTLFIDQWRKNKSNKVPAITGLISSLGFLIILGPEKFLLPSLVLTTGLLILLGRKEAKEDDD